MDAWVWPVAGALGGAVGWVAVGQQWRLYSEDRFRDERLSGRGLLAWRAVAALFCAGVVAIAFRPDYYDFGPALLTAAFGVVLIVLSSTDFERRRIPNRLSYPAIAVAAAFSWAWPDRSLGEVWFGLAVAGGVAVLMFALGAVVGRSLGIGDTPFGMGDVKLIALEGLLLGWPAVLGALFIGVVVAGVPSLVLIVAGKGRSTFSYGPYLAAGCLVVLLWFDRFG